MDKTRLKELKVYWYEVKIPTMRNTTKIHGIYFPDEWDYFQCLTDAHVKGLYESLDFAIWLAIKRFKKYLTTLRK